MRRLCGLVLLWLLLAITSAAGHEARPLHIEVSERAEGVYRLQWRAPQSLDPANAPRIVFPETCTPLTAPPPAGPAGDGLFRCAQDPAGETLIIDYPRYNPSLSALVRFSRLTGESASALLGPGETRWVLPARETAASVAWSYLRLGVRHILEGLDHLLFLVCIVWIAGDLRRILFTVTGFTLGHALTLSLAALEVIRLPNPPVEAAIALSILVLAAEIVRNRRETLSWRRPILISGAFGLVHGLGFASALQEIGLPQTQLLTGLIFFNVGVELGQALFVAAAFAVAIPVGRLLRRLDAPTSAARLAIGYAAGLPAAYWLIARVADFGAA